MNDKELELIKNSESLFTSEILKISEIDNIIYTLIDKNIWPSELLSKINPKQFTNHEITIIIKSIQILANHGDFIYEKAKSELMQNNDKVKPRIISDDYFTIVYLERLDLLNTTTVFYLKLYETETEEKIKITVDFNKNSITCSFDVATIKI